MPTTIKRVYVAPTTSCYTNVHFALYEDGFPIRPLEDDLTMLHILAICLRNDWVLMSGRAA